MKQTYEAVFESGVFRLLTPKGLEIPEGQKVRIVVEIVESPESILELATQVYDGLSEEEIEEIEEIILGRSNFFKGRGNL